MSAHLTVPLIFKAETFLFPGTVGVLFPSPDDGDGLSFNISNPQEGEEPIAVLKHAFRDGWQEFIRTDSRDLSGGDILFTGELERDGRIITFSIPISRAASPDSPSEAAEFVAHFIGRVRPPR